MFKEAIKTAVIAGTVSLMFCACSGKSEQESAQNLYDNAESMITSHDYTAALHLLDTLEVKYKSQTEIRRKGLFLREKAIEGLTMDSISACDLQLANAQIAADSLSHLMQHVDGTAGLEGHYTPAAIIAKQVLNQNSIEPRVDEQGYFFVIANVNGKSINANSLIFKAGGEQFTAPSSPVPTDRLVKVEGSELLSFTQEEMADAALWIENHANLTECTINGSKGQCSVKISPKERQAFVDAWHYAQALQTLRQSSIRREKLERRLQTARDHIANLYTPEDETK
jgi:hypothetical protein